MSQINTNDDISSNGFKTEKFAVKPAFLQLLKTVGADGNLFTLSQVLGYMKNYIISHNLYDKTNPRQIFCENDELGKVLGVNKFTIDDVMNLLTLVLYRLPFKKDCTDSSNNSSVDGMKRLLVEENVESKKLRLEEQSQAITRPLSPIVICIPEKPDYDSNCETDLSIQSYETALAKDSTDDLWFLEEEEEYDVELGNDTEDYFSVEYEVGSASSVADNLVSDTDSDIEDIVNAVLICKDDSDMEFWADSSDSDDDDDESTDPELAEGDKWTCSRCKSLNRPFMRYCQKCWDQRIGWLPENRRRRPPRRNRKRCKKNKRSKLGGNIAESKLRKEMSNSIEENATEEGQFNSAEERKSNDFHDAYSSNKNTEEKTFNNMERKVVDEQFSNTKEKTCDYFCTASTSYSSRERTALENEIIPVSDKLCEDSLKNLAVNQDSSAKLKRTSSDEICSNPFLSSQVIDKEANMCPLCMQREKTGIIVHGRTGHQMCCYSCARHLENQKKPCPICRRTIQRVIRNFCV